MKGTYTMSKRTQYTSKGQRRNVSSWSIKAGRKDVSELEIINRKIDAWKQGKKVMLTITNPIKSETNKPFIRVNAKEIWGKDTPYMMKTSQ